MSPFDHVLAVALIVAPGDPGPVPELAHVGPALRHVALDWQLLDPRESKALLVRPDAFAADLAWLRKRHASLEHAPYAGEADRLPMARTISEGMALNRARWEQWRRRLETEPPEPESLKLEGAVNEADRLYRLWDLMRDARRESYLVTERRKALASLRLAIGWAAFHRGDWPPPAPAVP
jgi:hypothetical protein